jgi:hypothetical protein
VTIQNISLEFALILCDLYKKTLEFLTLEIRVKNSRTLASGIWKIKMDALMSFLFISERQILNISI